MNNILFLLKRKKENKYARRQLIRVVTIIQNVPNQDFPIKEFRILKYNLKTLIAKPIVYITFRRDSFFIFRMMSGIANLELM